ncbi:cyclin-dependent kinase inhibitor 3 family protein [Vibrio viridaestus]|uniref:protein-tyrosine-phosphatase n=1 Tax=Vibrio viridaestus TaxID=2487322 RepID=A0A3N9TDH7_9VIBR|nr:cyclin-dependent kinase inhibitor 3 family protein [Vibrio viridaestus]RQW62241.1 phosphatase [Vibrio viridaestus]
MVRTSQSHPLQIAEVIPDEGYGKIGITFCPGKYDPLAATGKWERDLKLDLDVIENWQARLVLTLIEPMEMIELRVPRIGDEVQKRGMIWRHLPIADYSVPDADFETKWLTQGYEIRHLLRCGKNVLVHCKGGLGRAGMIAARLLVELGMEPKQAIRIVRKVRPGAIETTAQLALVRQTKNMIEEEE